MIQLTWPVKEQYGQLIKKNEIEKKKLRRKKKAHHNEAI